MMAFPRGRLSWIRGPGFGLLLAVLAAAAPALPLAPATPAGSQPVDLPPHDLKPGQFIWAPDASPSGPLVMVISLDEQLAYVYRNGLRIGVSTVSTGRKGKETPTGVFTILQKQKDHRSSLYDDAPMPFMQRLTWDGVALHAGRLPGYPASHGCIRLPLEFARGLYDVTRYGMTVVVAAEASPQAQFAHPGLFSPLVQADDVAEPAAPRLSKAEAFAWHPEKSPEGPLTILVGTSSRLVLVFRNGVEIGRARMRVTGDSRVGTQAYVLLDGDNGAPSAVVEGRPGRNWQSIALPGRPARPGTRIDPEAVRNLSPPPEFARLVYDAMQPGTTLLLTDAPVAPGRSGKATTLIDAQDAGDLGIPAPSPGPPSASPVEDPAPVR